MSVWSLFLTASLAIENPPKAGGLVFGSSVDEVRKVLGKESMVELVEDTDWRTFSIGGKNVVRVAFYRKRVSQFLFLLEKPLSSANARKWAQAFFPGMEHCREIQPKEAGPIDIYGTYIFYGRPFEAHAHLEQKGSECSSLSGEIQWMD